MKPNLLVTIIGFYAIFLVSCEKTEKFDSTLEGRWKLVSFNTAPVVNINPISTEDDNIILTFNQGVLTVKGNENEKFYIKNGEYLYETETRNYEYSSSKVVDYIVKLKDIEYIYYFRDGKLVISNAHVDGPYFELKRF